MKIMLVNGSPHENGSTARALKEAQSVFKKHEIAATIFWIGIEPIAGCTACKTCQSTGRCYQKDQVNAFLEKAEDTDGFVFASPVYFAGITGPLKCFMDRVFYCGVFSGKPAAAIVSCRRGGASTAFDQINKYFQIRNMPVVSSQYWNLIHGNGNRPDETEMDLEGLQTIRTMAENMVWLLKSLKAGGYELPQYEKRVRTDFIRGEKYKRDRPHFLDKRPVFVCL